MALNKHPNAWFAKFHNIVSKLGFSSNGHDSAHFTRKRKRGIVVLLLYVDDMIITVGIVELKQFSSQHFEIKDLGPLCYIF